MTDVGMHLRLLFLLHLYLTYFFCIQERVAKVNCPPPKGSGHSAELLYKTTKKGRIYHAST